MHRELSTGMLQGTLITELNAQVDRARNRSQVIHALEDALDVISPKQYPELVLRIESALKYAKEAKWAE